MSRARNIKPGFFKNDLLAECSVETRLLFIGLWCEADREGRLEYRPKRIKASCMPYDEVDVEDAIAELAERGFLILYEVGGIAHIQIRNWGKHQNPHHKEVGSVIEAPDGHIDTVCAGYIPLSNTIRNRVYARDGRVCRECGAKHGLSIDHIVPVSKGGNSTDDNLQVLCLGCNVRKGNKILSSSVHESCMDHGQAKRIASCPTDSLIPDSLLLIPDPPKEQPAVAVDLFDGITPEVVRDFKALRKAKKATITETAVDGIKREAAKAGVTFEAALRMCCERGWAGFKADWLSGHGAGTSSPPSRKLKELK